MRLSLRTLLLVALPAAPFLGAPWNGFAVAALGGGWLWLTSRPGVVGEDPARPRGRGRLAALALIAGALGVLGAPWLVERTMTVEEEQEEALSEVLERRWTELWRDLAAEAEQAAELLETAEQGAADPLIGPAGRDRSGDDAGRRRAFRILAERLERPEADRRGRFTLLLIDPDGEAVAWAGEGLLNEPDPTVLIDRGYDVSASFGSATLLAVEPLGDGRREWRMVAGRSFRTDRLPFDLPAALRVRSGGADLRWSVARAGTPLPPGARAVAAEGLPALIWLPGSGSGRSRLEVSAHVNSPTMKNVVNTSASRTPWAVNTV